ncbi:UTP--glucose-1-phosphate uridylyltransferase [Simkania negevensis]|uniref:UTP--glucose-1-phosphate uridylyltransferase n=1 Tax=Simkania negevensis TaxID=83561 RepID=A0ABS3ASW6_9BACT|nr:UTP--glucose-1-phosphate uridylyltransferase [Simkania negevensis]
MSDVKEARIGLEKSRLLVRLRALVAKLLLARSFEEKIVLLNLLPGLVKKYSAFCRSASGFEFLPSEHEYLVKAILALGQGNIVFRMPSLPSDVDRKLPLLLDKLGEIEAFYADIGGVVGYHVKVLELTEGKDSCDDVELEYRRPSFFDIRNDTPSVKNYLVQGVVNMPVMGEIYPIGGAGDRLGLFCDRTKEPLPAAKLLFCGRTLLEGMIRDLEARESLYYKLFGKRIFTPVAILTSEEKNNATHVREIFETQHWFGRPKESFFFFLQPSVPLITDQGGWCMEEPLKLSLKPGGHGVIWKLAKEQGVFDWFRAHGRSKALVRQINNPLAGVDHGLLAFSGFGCSENKLFGFASCGRSVGSAEGMLTLVRSNTPSGIKYAVSNVEYTDFKKRGLDDLPASLNSPYSLYPSNTNILFVDLDAVERAVDINPVPGMLVNMKSKFPFCDEEGDVRICSAGRLESTMQNISDSITTTVAKDFSAKEVAEEEIAKSLGSYLTFNRREKTIAVTKKSYQPGSYDLLETPEGCLYQMVGNAHDLLVNWCEMELPDVADVVDHVEQGPNFLFHYHPALGPLYSTIAQKIRRGRMAQGAELQLEISELEMVDVSIQGSLLVFADSVTGSKDGNGVLQYGAGQAKCVLSNLSVVNRGMVCMANQPWWKNEIARKEALTIILHGDAEFVACDVSLEGNQVIEVPSGERMTAYYEKGELRFHTEPITSDNPLWNFSVDSHHFIRLTRRRLNITAR